MAQQIRLTEAERVLVDRLVRGELDHLDSIATKPFNSGIDAMDKFVERYKEARTLAMKVKDPTVPIPGVYNSEPFTDVYSLERDPSNVTIDNNNNNSNQENI